MRISDWSSDVCSSDLGVEGARSAAGADVERAGGVVIVAQDKTEREADRPTIGNGERTGAAVAYVQDAIDGPDGARTVYCRRAGGGISPSQMGGAGRSQRAAGGEDRKSTRLNSSH